MRSSIAPRMPGMPMEVMSIVSAPVRCAKSNAPSALTTPEYPCSDMSIVIDMCADRAALVASALAATMRPASLPAVTPAPLLPAPCDEPAPHAPSARAAPSAASIRRVLRRTVMVVFIGRRQACLTEVSRSRGPASLQLPLVHVHHRAVGTALAVPEAEALVEPARRDVVVARAEVHGVGTACSRFLDRGLHERAPEPAAAPLRHDVQLGEIALESRGPDRRTEAQEGEPVGTVTADDHGRVARVEEHPQTRRERGRAGRDVVVL